MSKQVVSVTLNPCVDKTITLDGFTHGGMNRAAEVRYDFSGKGMNVSRVLAKLGYPTECLGFNYSDGGAALERELDSAGVAYDFIKVDGILRTNIKLVERDGVMTEVNERGGYVAPEYIEKLLAKIKSRATGAEIFVLSGSAPQGVPKDIYRRITEAVKETGGAVKIVLDAEGELLTNGLDAVPYAVKPNVYELETAFGTALRSRVDILEACAKLAARGVQLICVSMGGEGALLTDGSYVHYLPAPAVPVRGVTGAGDSMVAGLCAAMLEKLPPDEMLRYAVAAAGGTVMREGTQLCEAEGFCEVLGGL